LVYQGLYELYFSTSDLLPTLRARVLFRRFNDSPHLFGALSLICGVVRMDGDLYLEHGFISDIIINYQEERHLITFPNHPPRRGEAFGCILLRIRSGRGVLKTPGTQDMRVLE